MIAWIAVEESGWFGEVGIKINPSTIVSGRRIVGQTVFPQVDPGGLTTFSWTFFFVAGPKSILKVITFDLFSNRYGFTVDKQIKMGFMLKVFHHLKVT